MSDYGVSQRRERVFFIGVRNDLPYEPSQFFPETEDGAHNLRDLLSTIPPINSTNDENHNLHTGTSKKQKWISILKEGENLIDLSEEEIRKREKEHGFTHENIAKTLMGYRRLHGGEISPTMMFGNTCLPIHPTEDRSISVREAATIQSFPQDFIFKGGISYQYKQVGNSVPPHFSILLAKKMKNVFDMIPVNAYDSSIS